MPNAPLKILILEDDDLDYQVLTRHISSHQPPKYELFRARTIAEASAIIAEHNITAALVDHGLSGGDSGLEFVKQQGGRESAFPSIILTGMDFGAIEEQIFDTGAYDYIEKIAVTRDLVDRTIRFAVSAHGYESRLRDAVKDVETQANLNRDTLADFSREMKDVTGTMSAHCDIIAKHGEHKTVSDAAGKIAFAVRQLETFLHKFSELIDSDDGPSEKVGEDIPPQERIEESAKAAAQ